MLSDGPPPAVCDRLFRWPATGDDSGFERTKPSFARIAPSRTHASPSRALARIEAWVLRRAIERHYGRKVVAARMLATTREGLYKKLKRLGIE